MTMNRRQALCAMTTSFAAAHAAARPAFAQAPKRPNIIFIMADDLGYADLSCTGSSHIKTPAIDSIAANGRLLTNGYANSPVCSPTRTALLSGRYQYRFPIGLEEPLPTSKKALALPAGTPSIASVLRERGYYTKLIGKWHLGDPPHNGPLQNGYDAFFGIPSGGVDYFRHRAVVDGADVGLGLMQDNNPVEREGYMTTLLGDETIATIEAARSDLPFLISLHFTAPHWPWEGPEDEAVSRTLKSYTHYDAGNIAVYGRMVEAMDAQVARIIATLKMKGLYDDTIIVFTSDNGGERFSQTWPFVGVKGEVLEGGIRVPILAQWPGRIPAGTVSAQVMMSMDFLPTLLSAAGGDPASAGNFDGVNLLGAWMGETVVDRTIFWRFKAGEQRAVRHGSLKYLKLRDKEHLFDLAVDARERADLKDTRPAEFAALKQRYEQWDATMLPYPEDSYSFDVRGGFSDRY